MNYWRTTLGLRAIEIKCRSRVATRQPQVDVGKAQIMPKNASTRNKKEKKAGKVRNWISRLIWQTREIEFSRSSWQVSCVIIYCGCKTSHSTKPTSNQFWWMENGKKLFPFDEHNFDVFCGLFLRKKVSQSFRSYRFWFSICHHKWVSDYEFFMADLDFSGIAVTSRLSITASIIWSSNNTQKGRILIKFFILQVVMVMLSFIGWSARSV